MKHISKVSVVKANTNACDDIVGLIADPMPCIKEIISKATATQ